MPFSHAMTTAPQVGEDGHLDLCVLNAGISMSDSFASLSRRGKKGELVAIMRRLMDVNYFGAVGVLDACFAHMERSPGGVRLIAVDSVAGLAAPPMRSGYAASKFALRGDAPAPRATSSLFLPPMTRCTCAPPYLIPAFLCVARCQGSAIRSDVRC